MRVCKKCGKSFPSSMVINGKHQNLMRRSYCLECSPFGARRGYNLRKEKTRERCKDGRPHKVCPICEYEFPWTKNNVCSGCRSTLQRWKNRERAYDFLGGKCNVCGTDDHDILTCHHRDPATKKFNVSHCWHLGWRSLEEEIKKCDLLCFNCHIKTHAVAYHKQLEQVKQYFGEV